MVTRAAHVKLYFNCVLTACTAKLVFSNTLGIFSNIDLLTLQLLRTHINEFGITLIIASQNNNNSGIFPLASLTHPYPKRRHITGIVFVVIS